MKEAKKESKVKGMNQRLRRGSTRQQVAGRKSRRTEKQRGARQVSTVPRPFDGPANGRGATHAQRSWRQKQCAAVCTCYVGDEFPGRTHQKARKTLERVCGPCRRLSDSASTLPRPTGKAAAALPSRPPRLAAVGTTAVGDASLPGRRPAVVAEECLSSLAMPPHRRCPVHPKEYKVAMEYANETDARRRPKGLSSVESTTSAGGRERPVSLCSPAARTHGSGGWGIKGCGEGPLGSR